MLQTTELQKQLLKIRTKTYDTTVENIYPIPRCF